MKKLQCIMLNEEEAEKTFADRAERLKLSCCICEEEGWLLNDEYVPKQNMHISSCGHESHAVCISCSSKLASADLENSLQSGMFMKVLKCPFPYSIERCRGHFSRRRWEPLVSLELLQRRKGILSGFGFLVKCSACANESRVKNPESIWTCQKCNRTSCGRCDEETCSCLGISQDKLTKGYSRNFSFRNFSGQCRPLRRNEVSKEMIKMRIKSLIDHCPWLHAQCPCCEVPLYKSSACNDMRHCGESHICYICLQRSFPWEGGIDTDHWTKCPRWDYEVSWYPCREGSCIHDGKECSEPSHAQAIAKMHEFRWRAAMENLNVDAKLVSL